MRRTYDLHIKCSDSECHEYSNYAYDTRKEYTEGVKRNKTWTCVRHMNPNSVLSKTNTNTSETLVCIRKQFSENSFGQFWQLLKDVGTEKLQSGFQYGNGYKAWADEFPEGTKLVVTSEIILPDENEVTHEVFFGENIKRVLNTFKK
jgi:hypothetical protein